MNWILLALAGAAGTLSRHGLNRGFQQLLGSPLYGTWAANLLGCLLFGLVWQWTREHGPLPVEWQPWLLTGFMGAFTTFSTWISEGSGLLERGLWMGAGIHLVLQVAAGLALFRAGMALAR